MPVLDKVFNAAAEHFASDIHIAPGEPVVLRIQGQLKRLKSGPLTQEQCRKLILEILTPAQRKQLEQDLQLDFVYDLGDVGRFRGNAMFHQAGMSAAFRFIPPWISSLYELGLPPVVEKVLDNHQGLILVTGAAGQGKSTTMAAMVDYINTKRSHHVLTVEDPIEFVHPYKKAVVNQRQLGEGTLSYANALRAALREDPDVIMIGELRDLETISLAISAAETGHLVIGTLACGSAPKTIDRIIDSYPAGEQNQIRAMLSEGLKAVVTQRLIPNMNGKTMELAVEVLIVTLPISNLIREGKVFQIPSIMQTAKRVGMVSMDDSLIQLVEDGKVAASEAVLYAKNAHLFNRLLTKEKVGAGRREGSQAA
ncbi:type IV pilus twitching motility protein PilT [Desulfatibacillum aliphaticivorans]|uniref:Twitching motility protein, PilT n=1 Tax=Desulfatibacillum aliphaticivorans TaxID=218208 RepID=B8FGS0_DESAL|nr:type IV pilus twitching motility protein PilT [Desulfatibacillum aliphaticivorans]ACL05300.1 Twitching motility protein, PilT [Desulfatibacillum aliphaticivorans]